MNDFVRSKVCFYSSMFSGTSNMHRIIECAREKGVYGVEMMNFCDELRSPDTSAAKELAALAHGYGLALPVFSAGINLVGEDVAEQNLERLCRYAEICSELEIPVLHHTIAPALTNVYGDDVAIAEVFKRGTDAALRINDFSARLGVRTVVEDQGFVFNGKENYRRFLDATEGKIGALLDVGNIRFAGESPEELLTVLTEPPVHVHLKDYIYCTESENPLFKDKLGRTFADTEIGRGDIDLSAVADGLRTLGYDGLYSMEYCHVKDLSEVDRTLAHVSRIFA